MKNSGRKKNRFLADVQAFHEEIVDYGLYSALSQAVLKLTSPGVPDIYQGQELWDFSLVDPDNRRPVNFGECRWLLGELKAVLATEPDNRREFIHSLAQTPRDSRLKLLVTFLLLQLRKQHPDLFRKGTYQPLKAHGSKAEHIVAFARQIAGDESKPAQTLVVVVPRLIAQLLENGADSESNVSAPLGESVWLDTTVPLPGGNSGKWRNLFTDETIESTFAEIGCSLLFRDFPVAVLLG